jgi:hypothetical protein
MPQAACTAALQHGLLAFPAAYLALPSAEALADRNRFPAISFQANYVR